VPNDQLPRQAFAIPHASGSQKFRATVFGVYSTIHSSSILRLHDSVICEGNEQGRGNNCRAVAKKCSLKSVIIESPMELTTEPKLNFPHLATQERTALLLDQETISKAENAGAKTRQSGGDGDRTDVRRGPPPETSQRPSETSSDAISIDNHSAAVAKSCTLTDWIAEINKVWKRGASSTLDLARVVSAAKIGLRQHYGQWSQLWKAGGMPVSKSTADRLAEIGQRMGWLDSATSLNVPRGWNILYCLARLDRATLERLIQQGVVHPELTLRAAKELVAQLRGRGSRASTRKANVRQRLLGFAEFVRRTLGDWGSEERELAAEELTTLIEQVSAAGRRHVVRNYPSQTFVTERGFLIDQ